MFLLSVSENGMPPKLLLFLFLPPVASNNKKTKKTHGEESQPTGEKASLWGKKLAHVEGKASPWRKGLANGGEKPAHWGEKPAYGDKNLACGGKAIPLRWGGGGRPMREKASP